MHPITPQLVYRQVAAEHLDAVRPLWEKLNAHHAGLSPLFGGAIRLRTFDARKQRLLTKAADGKLRIELVSAEPGGLQVAYCISTVSTDVVGEIDSVFVEEHLRGQGVGTELVRRALAWLDSLSVTSKLVSVMYQNDEALAFYRRFGFHPRAVLMQDTHGDAVQCVATDQQQAITNGALAYHANLDGVDWQEVAALYDKAGLGGRDPARYAEACRRSYACVFAQADGHTVGMGRVVSDGYMAHAIFDVAVLPEYQGRGIGRRIMELLHGKLPSPKCLIYAVPGKEGFYAKLGYYPCKTGMLRVGDAERTASARKAGYI